MPSGANAGFRRGQGLDRGVGPDALVLLDDERVALALGDRNGRDLVGQPAFLAGDGGPLVARGGELVLRFAGDPTALA